MRAGRNGGALRSGNPGNTGRPRSLMIAQSKLMFVTSALSSVVKEPGWVGPVRLLDLDALGTEIRERLRTERAGQGRPGERSFFGAGRRGASIRMMSRRSVRRRHQ